MKLKNIKISNYRCFKEAEIGFDNHITLVVGKNGAGKTAILDAVAVSVSTFLLGIDGGVSRSILKDDARYEFHDLNGTIDPQHQFPVCIESTGACLDQQNVKWIRSLNSESGKTTIKDAGELTGLAKKAQNQIMTGDKSLVLPLISYYGTGRLYAQKKEYEFALNPIPLYYKSYEEPHLGIHPQWEGREFVLLDGECEVLDGISVYPTPGHSVGHQTVVVNTKEGQFHCCGDLIFTYDNLKPCPDIFYDITPPSRFVNIVEEWHSIEELKKRAKSQEFILPTHAPEMIDLIKSGRIIGK